MGESKIRFTKSVNHQAPDRVPMDIGSTTVSSIELKLYDNLKKFLGLPESSVEPFSKWFSLVEPEEDIAEYFGLDFKRVGLDDRYRIFKISNDRYIDEFDIAWVKNGLDLEVIESPIRTLNQKTISNMKLPRFNEFDRMTNIEANIDNYLKSKYALVGDIWCSGILTLSMRLLGFAELLEYTLSNKSMLRKLFENLTELFNEFTDGFLSKVGNFIEVAVVGDDLGTQESLLMSPKSYRELIKPFHKSIIENIKEHTKAKVMFHTDGAVYDLIPDLIDIGVDILNPIQTTANKMDPYNLKKSYGKDLVFWGGLDVQNLLFSGNTENIDFEVKKLIKVLGSGGGYIFASSNNLIGNMKPENVTAAFLAARDTSIV